ncbi:transthyretin [Abortiporus biennis]|nr:transthyretin [Abortiporus biennis]
MSKSPITCHVLDSSIGKPASGVPVSLHTLQDVTSGGAVIEPLAQGLTDSDGRCMQLWPLATDTQTSEERSKLESGKLYKVVFKIDEYFQRTGRKCFYPYVEITFQVENPTEHYHIPLLISPYSYTTYRGS